MTVLVIAAHPDDEILGCGGTISNLADTGHDVYVAILGEGITSRYTDRETVKSSELEALHSKAQQASDLLGVRELFLYSLPDNRFDTVPLLAVVKVIEGLVDRLQPETVYTQHGGDLNIDHVITYRATLTATRPMRGTSVKRLYAYPVASSSEWAFGQFAPGFQGSVYVDITANLERKIVAMQLYESEARPFPHPRSPKALRAAAQAYGSQVGVEAAEPFHLVREIVTI